MGALKSSDWRIAFDFDDPVLIQSKGIDITIPSGTNYGFYITFLEDNATEYTTLYSQANENTLTGGDEKTNGETFSNFAVTFIHPYSGYQYFSFEDWTGYSSDADFNDLIFILGNAKSITKTSTGENAFKEETYNWLICAEDLGTTDDFDFNDMILGVTEVVENGISKVTFTAMAAGGTLPLKLYINNCTKVLYNSGEGSSINTSNGLMYPDGHSEIDEFHGWFDDGTISSGTMINTNSGSGKENLKGRTCTLYFSEFSLDPTAKGDAYGTNGSLANFYITVSGSGGTQVIAPKTDADSSAPQMFVIEDKGYNGSPYQWPVERKKIQEAYPSAYKDENDHTQGWETVGFISWTRDQDLTQNWYESSARNNTCRLFGGEKKD